LLLESDGVGIADLNNELAGLSGNVVVLYRLKKGWPAGMGAAMPLHYNDFLCRRSQQC